MKHEPKKKKPIQFFFFFKGAGEIFSLFSFLPNLVISDSHPSDDSSMTYHSYQPGRLKAITSSFRSSVCAAPGGDVTHLEDSAIRLLPYSRAHRCP